MAIGSEFLRLAVVTAVFAGSAATHAATVAILGQGCPGHAINQTAGSGVAGNTDELHVTTGAVRRTRPMRPWVRWGHAPRCTRRRPDRHTGSHSTPGHAAEYRDSITITGPNGAQNVAGNLNLHAHADFTGTRAGAEWLQRLSCCTGLLPEGFFADQLQFDQDSGLDARRTLRFVLAPAAMAAR